MQAIRGTYDLFGENMRKHNLVLKNIKEVVEAYNFEEIKTPIIENTELFKRSSGDSSDIVQKEMYTFEDKGGRSITMRPEITASVVRSFLTNKIYGERLPNYKFFYYGEAFRYERPQSLRYRQFYQFGVERLGEDSVYTDAEIILMARQILMRFNLEDKTTLKINSIGTSQDRLKYNAALKEYFSQYKEELCEDCQSRLDKNALRILDCKIDGQKDFVLNAPKLKDYLSEESLQRFEKLLDLLKQFNIPYVEDDTLVRGLDYYNDTVFEFEYNYNGNPKTILAGGRYDNLINEVGNVQMPAIGFAIGMERMIESAEEVNDFSEDLIGKTDVYYINLEESTYEDSLKSMELLRSGGINSHANFTDRSFKSQIKLAESSGAVYAVIFNKDYEETKEVKIKNLITGEDDITLLVDFEAEILQK